MIKSVGYVPLPEHPIKARPFNPSNAAVVQQLTDANAGFFREGRKAHTVFMFYVGS